MESIYYVMCFACHRRCRHCYEDRFRPYTHGDLTAVVNQAVQNFHRIIDNFPEQMTYYDHSDTPANGHPIERIGRVILSGGEVLIEPVRAAVTYPAIKRLVERYAGRGGVRVVIQTTGDSLTDQIVEELLACGIWMISVSGVDDFHVGLEGSAKQTEFVESLSRLFERHGMREADDRRALLDEEGPVFGFLGATPGSWIGKLWPRGRAWQNGLSQATLEDNFCNQWSGGLNFLRHGHSGSEVSVEPTGDVYPCCIKTALPIGNLLEEGLIEILDSLTGISAYEAISAGQPERMGVEHGWDAYRFIANSETTTPLGKTYRNLCIGCDRFHASHMGPILAAARARRRARRTAIE